MAKNKRQREHDSNVVKLANTYARTFNSVADRAGFDLPMPLLVKLIELFTDAINTGEALERDYGQPPSADAVDPHASSTGKLSTREKRS